MYYPQSVNSIRNEYDDDITYNDLPDEQRKILIPSLYGNKVTGSALGVDFLIEDTQLAYLPKSISYERNTLLVAHVPDSNKVWNYRIDLLNHITEYPQFINFYKITPFAPNQRHNDLLVDGVYLPPADEAIQDLDDQDYGIDVNKGKTVDTFEDDKFFGGFRVIDD